MIPIELTVQGLYSYKEPQTIYFEQLTTSQLFGIFGTVGSGKSSILEAIVFALYDRSERLNRSGDNRYYNMLNLQSRQLLIDFTFQVTSPELVKYRFAVTAQRKKKDYERVEIKERRHFRWDKDEWKPLEVSDAASLIGMTYENFMQTVIIPQGKFREFIDQKPNDRTQMLKELFRLERFDLSHKTNLLLSAVRAEITDSEARLSEIGPVSAEAIDAARREVQELELSLHQNAALLREADATCQTLEQLRKLFADKEIAQEHRQALHQQQSEYAAKEKQLREYREAETYFNDKFTTLTHTTAQLSKVRTSVEQLVEQLATNEQQVAKARRDRENAQAMYEDRENIRTQCQDLEHLIRISQVQRTLPELTSQEATARAEHEQLAQQVASTKQQVKQADQQLRTLEDQQEEQVALQEVVRWYQLQAQYEAEQRECDQRLSLQQRALHDIHERKRQLLTAHQWTENGTFDNFYHHYSTKKKQLAEALAEVIQEISRLKVKAEWVSNAQQLTSGEPCPLCGSTHHPSIAHPDSLAATLQVEEQALAELKEQEEALDQLAHDMRQLQSEFQKTTGILESAERELQATATKQEEHAAAFTWDSYRQCDPKEVIQRGRKYTQLLEEQKELRQQRTIQQQQLDSLEEKLSTQQQRWQQAQQALATGQSHVHNYRSLLKVLSYERYQRYTEPQLEESLRKGHTKLKQIESNYETTRERLQQCEKEKGILEARRDAEKILMEDLAARASSLEQEIQELCYEKEFDSVDYVKSLINLELDTEAVHDDILSYKNRLHTAEENFRKLIAQTQDQRYDALQHREALETCTALKQANEQLQHAWAVGKREVTELQEKLVKVQRLGQTLGIQKGREENLKELAGLFRGSGFVNYASTVLLEEVCRAANVRFKQLTKNNLSLELNGSNDFIVRDYLNDGKTRLLKTLSGGQIFQAALCLALALAENIKSLNQAQQSFFFLDEGFGALDKNSLRVVFDTLKSLRKENRIVGIISHVEELQQEIDVYLKVEHDKERGSLIKGSWEI